MENRPRLPSKVKEYTRVFGVTLAEAVQKSAKINPNVPDIIVKCITYIEEKALKEEGIFRLSGGNTQINQLKNAFDSGENVDLSTVGDENAITGLLKLYFRELPENVFTNPKLEQITSAQTSDINETATKLSVIVTSLPIINKTVTSMLFDLLRKVVSFSNENKMSCNNLAIVWSPTLGIPLELVTIFIEKYNIIFFDENQNLSSFIQWNESCLFVGANNCFFLLNFENKYMNKFELEKKCSSIIKVIHPIYGHSLVTSSLDCAINLYCIN